MSIIIGVQGGRGSFSEQAGIAWAESKKYEKYKIEYLYTSEKVMDAVERGAVDFGVCAIHNAVGGVVDETISAIAEHRASVADKIGIEITHSLMIRRGADFDRIDTIYAHPQVFAQCRHHLAANFPNLKLVSGQGDLIDTAAAARALAEERLPDTVAILGPEGLASIHGFDIVAQNQQDQKNNLTTFIVLKKLGDH